MSKLKHTFKTDILFKLLFVKNPELLQRLVAHLLRIQFESISQFEVRNPEMPPDSIDKKFCRLDIHMIVNGQLVNLEVQVENEYDYPERVLYHWARVYSSSLSKGKDYSDLPRTIIISILDFTLFDSKEFHSEFKPLEVTRYTPLTDRMVLHFFELSKLPVNISSNDMLLLWLALFKADTEEELQRINRMGVPELSEAVSAYHRVMTSNELKEMERLNELAGYNETAALRNAEQRGEKRANAKWKGVVTEKDAALSAKDAEIAELKLKLAEQSK